MMPASSARITTEQIIAKLKPVFLSLLDAYDYAHETGSEPWDFAMHIQELIRLGFTETDLRWLVRKGFVEHACDVTVEGDDGRRFRQTGMLTFRGETCFVLTEMGLAKAQCLLGDQRVLELDAELTHAMNGRTVPLQVAQIQTASQLPHWDAVTRELRLNGTVIKRFKWEAVNQEIVLSAFQEEGWPSVVDDPLPPTKEQDPKRRLQDTIKSLNRNQENELLRFHGNGTGEAIRWKAADVKQ
jgi:hypothetical protein